MFDKFRCQTQFSAFKHQRRPPARTMYLAKPMRISIRSLPNTAGSAKAGRIAAYLNGLKAILKVM